MTDFIIFERNWNRAVSGLIGWIKTNESGLLKRDAVNKTWQRELRTNRFESNGPRDEAAVFLDELRGRRPDAARKISTMLAESRMNIGIDTESLAVKAAGTLAGVSLTAVSMTHRGHIGKVLPAAVALVTAGGAALTAADVGKSTKNNVIHQILEESKRQLEDYRTVLAEEEN